MTGILANESVLKSARQPMAFLKSLRLLMLKENLECLMSFSNCSQEFPLCYLHAVNLQEEPKRNLNKMGVLKLLEIFLVINQ